MRAFPASRPGSGSAAQSSEGQKVKMGGSFLSSAGSLQSTVRSFVPLVTRAHSAQLSLQNQANLRDKNQQEPVFNLNAFEGFARQICAHLVCAAEHDLTNF